jgi:hypothetical protein
MPKYPFTKNCKHCNNEFAILRASQRNAQFCKFECYNLHKQEKRLGPTKSTTCLNCGSALKKHQFKYCSKSCSAIKNNSLRGPKSLSTRQKTSEKMQGRKRSQSAIIKSILTKGQRILHLDPNRHCLVCNNDTGSRKRKLCSSSCRAQYASFKSRTNPRCGGQKHTHRSIIENIVGEYFIAESSYEVKVAELLNELNVMWIRPKFVWYVDHDNKKRRYYPDFFLPEYNLYLDPKNDYLIKTDIIKIKLASEQNKITVIILGKDDLSADTIKKLVGYQGIEPRR